jgi:RHS repeat-associated protein
MPFEMRFSATLLLSEVTNNVYGDGAGRVLRKDANGQVTLYVGGGMMELSKVDNMISGTRFYTQAGVQVASRNTSNGVEWTLGDAQGSISTAINQATGAARNVYYLPYGGVRASSTALTNDHTFLNQVLDGGSSLNYLNNRYMDPGTGTFLSVDPLVASTVMPYLYGDGNPVTYSDPTGLCSILGSMTPWGQAECAMDVLDTVGDALDGASEALVTGNEIYSDGGNVLDPNEWTSPPQPDTFLPLAKELRAAKTFVARLVIDSALVMAEASLSSEVMATSSLDDAGSVLVRPAGWVDDGAGVADDAAVRIGLRPTRHSVNQKINRLVSTADELDAYRNPLKVTEVKVDRFGRPSQRYVGRRATVARNPSSGKIVSVNPTSTQRVSSLVKRS